jgi:hypothetical protein
MALKDRKPGSLPTEVASRFKMHPNFHPGEVAFKGRVIDLTKITVAEAEELMKDKDFTLLIANTTAKEK